MFKKRPIRVMTKVVVEFREGTAIVATETIELKQGQKFKYGFARHPAVYNSDGSVARILDWSTKLTYDTTLDYKFQYDWV
jgi:hypothetical protein